MGETIGKYFRKTDMGEVYGKLLVSENDIITENTYLKSCKSTRTSIEQASSYWLLLEYVAINQDYKYRNAYKATQGKRISFEV